MKVSKLVKAFLLGLASATFITASASAQTGVISWNYDSAGTIGGSGTATAFGDHGTGGAGDFAGVVDAQWWGNSWNGSSQNFNPTNLAYSDGTASTLDLVSTNANGTFQVVGDPGPGVDSDGKWNRNLLNGYINGGTTTATLTQIPTAYQTSGWLLYVYVMSDVDTRVWNAQDGTGTVFYGGADPTAVSADNPAGFSLSTFENPVGYNTPANYVVFSGNGASVTVTVNFLTSDQITASFGGITGFQLVQVPEPTTFAMLLGGAGMLMLVRRRRA